MINHKRKVGCFMSALLLKKAYFLFGSFSYFGYGFFGSECAVS